MNELRILLAIECDIGHADPWIKRYIRGYPADIPRSTVEGQLFLDADDMFSELHAETSKEPTP